jgi:cephalosporin hydroxylase
MTTLLDQLKRGHATPGQVELVRDFNKVFYHGPDGTPLWQTISWLGVPIWKCPLDLWIYQEILCRTRPEVIVECGVYAGGTTLYLATLCDILGAGTVLGCDITLGHTTANVRAHPRIQLLEGSSTDPAIHAAIAAKCQGRRTMVILDSDHSYQHVLQELRLYAPLVAPECYLICEDTNVNGHPVLPDYGPGPHEAVQDFLRANADWYADPDCERLLVTFNPHGYLRRRHPAPAAGPEDPR